LSSAAWNVAIVGAGPAGCATAIALAHAGVERVCVIDPDRRPGLQIGETLPPDVRVVLDRLGVWEDFVAQEHESCLGSCSAWGDEVLGYNDFVLNTYGRGWHLDRHRFNALLRGAAESRAAAFMSGAKVVGVGSRTAPRYELKLKQTGGELADLRARYVVDASGTRSVFASQVGARRMFVDRLAFVYGFFEAGPGASASRLTMIEAAEDGWWYAVGLPDSKVAVAFATEPQTVREHGLSLERRWFARVLRTQHIAPRLDQCRFLPGTLVIRGAPSFLLDCVAGQRWLAVGDAAAAYDPLASQGIYKALDDGLVAADAIAAALASDAELSPNYAKSIAESFTDYQASCSHFYRLETRWSGSPFWRRRVERLERRPTVLQ
jgi:flavin-dependent dehydrogenase